jgi:hypothetical protein
MQSERDTVGVSSPVGLTELESVPFDSCLAEIVFQGDVASFGSLIEDVYATFGCPG